MDRNREFAAFHTAVAAAYEEWLRLVTWARVLGVAPPSPPVASSESNGSEVRAVRGRKDTGGRRVNRRHKARSRPADAATSILPPKPAAKEAGIPIGILTRPAVCLAILRRNDKPMTTGEIVAQARALGFDWTEVPGGESNAVHGALHRELLAKRVQKGAGGPWVLLDTRNAPVLSPDNRTAIVPDSAGGGRYAAEARRRLLLELMGKGVHRAHDLFSRLRSEALYDKLTRASFREDLGRLLDERKVKRIGTGRYRRAEGVEPMMPDIH